MQRKLLFKVFLPALVLMKKWMCRIEKGNTTLRVAVLSTFDKIISADRVRSQIMTFWESFLAPLIPVHHFHHYIAMQEPTVERIRVGWSWFIWYRNRFQANDQMSPQNNHFDDYEEIPLGQFYGIPGGWRIRRYSELQLSPLSVELRC